MSLTIKAPDATHDLKPRIVVIGVGGAGGNAVNNMIRSNLEGVEFVVANTDAQALTHAEADRKIQLGANRTKGLGAGAQPMIGREAAEESLTEVLEHLQGANMVFITAGMGGGTGTGAAPVIAQAARDSGLLTVGVVTKPFQFEGTHRMRAAEAGIEDLQQFVDTLIIIPNQNLFRVANEKTTFADAFKMADDVLYSGVRGVTDLMVMPGLINLDFADIRTVMSEMGKAMMGTGEASGEDRATSAAESAISNPLLEDATMRGARGVLINITGGGDMTLFEVDEAANRIRQEVDAEANIIFGSTFDESLEGLMRVSVVATGIEAEGAVAGASQYSGLTPLRPRRIEPVAEPAMNTPEVAEAPVTEPAVMFAEDDAADDVPEIRDTAEAQIDIEDAVTAAEEGNDPAWADEDRDAPAATGTQHGVHDGAGESELFSDMAEARPDAPPEPVRPKDAFIPTRPVQVPDQAREPLVRPADAFREAEMVNAGGGSAIDQQAPAAKGRPSLFSRMTGIGLSVKEERAAQAAPVQEPAQAPAQVPNKVEAIPAATSERPAVRPLPTTAERAPSRSMDPVRQDTMEPDNPSAVPSRPEADLASTRADEEMLEIPAFLRRQAN